MTELLMYSNRKCEPIFWDITLKSQHDLAFLDLFNMLDDKDWRCYNFEPEDAPKLDIPEEIANSTDVDRLARKAELVKRHRCDLADFNEQRSWYTAARTGDVAAARKLLGCRQGYEYEQWSTHSTEN